MSTPSDYSTSFKELEEFTESLPDFHPEYTNASLKTTLMHNHILISYFLGDVELHSTKFYTANLGEQDIMSTFLDRLEEDVEEAFTAHKLREFFDSFPPLKPAEPEYVWNTQPILDAAPTIPGLVKIFDVTYLPSDENYIVQYKLSDGTPVAEYKLPQAMAIDIYAGTYDSSEHDEYESFTETILAALEDLESKGFIIRKDLAA